MSVRVTVNESETWLEQPRDAAFWTARALGARPADAELVSSVLAHWEQRFADEDYERMLP